ncbi:PREDICTED: vitellogenin-A2-like [Thamnophis sirtalis]|uniref:Vitellogenin-A2-like n=1 Tax=Thamnophis sirtalis TaxID=35019 RepID=A0A6I9XBE0_9SAUR|nr:PREDICTED: vitellogenin-A2-like [Thamnophis sirtalis]
MHAYSFRSVKKQKPGKQSDEPSESDSQQYYKRKGGVSGEQNIKDPAMKPYATVTFRYRYTDKREAGHDLVVFKGTSALKVTVKDITRPANPVVCFTFYEVNPHKTTLNLRAGQDCRDYNFLFEIETGLLAGKPALQATFKYPKVSKQLLSYINKCIALIPGIAARADFTHKLQKNAPQEISMIMALKRPDECTMIMKLPEDLLYNDNCRLPYSVPMVPKGQTSKIADIPKLLLASLNGVCKVNEKRILSFNNEIITKGLPDDCFINVLGDCTCRKRLIVLMKYETAHNNNILIEIHTQNL